MGSIVVSQLLKLFRDHDHDIINIGPQNGYHRKDEEETGEGEHDIHKSHQEGIDPPTFISCHRTHQDPNEDGDPDRDESNG